MWRREKPSSAPELDRIHVSGHTPLPRVRRRKQTRTIQIDTGCVYGGRLSAWCAKRDRVVSVKSVY